MSSRKSSIVEPSIMDGAILHYNDKTNQLIHRVFEHLLEEKPSLRDFCAVLHSDRCLTFGELNVLANRLARQLVAKLMENRKLHQDGYAIVAVCMPSSERLIATLFAILKMGAAYLPLDATLPPARMSHILSEAKPICVLVENAWNQPQGVYSGLIVRYVDLLLPGDPSFRDDNLSADEVIPQGRKELVMAAVLYTSGSTGTPSGVMLTHYSIMSRLRWQWHMFPFTDDEIGCFKTVLTFIDSVPEIFAPLLRGREIVVIPRSVVQDPSAFVAMLEKHQIRRLILVPSLLRAILLLVKMHPEKKHLPDLRWVIWSGEVMCLDLAHDFFTQFGGHDKLLFNFYGSTEVTGDVTYEVFASAEDVRLKTVEGKLPIGTPVDNTTIYLANENGELIPRGEIGEICVSGAHLATGYLAMTDHKKFVINRLSPREGHEMLYRTGDYGFINNRTLYYEGRKDAQIKVRGQRVDLSEVEKAAMTICGVEAASALCYQPSQPNQTIVLFYMARSQECLVAEVEVTSHLKQILAPYMIPYVLRVDKIPLLVNGKVDRQALLRHFEERAASGEAAAIDLVGVTEENIETAVVVLTTIASVLGLGRLGGPLTLDSNFFESGGNSLNVMIVLNQLQDRGYCISISEFLLASNLREVMQHIIYKGNKCPSLLDYEPPQRRSSGSTEPNIFSAVVHNLRSLQHVDEEEAVQLVAECFALKSDLERFMGVTVADFSSLISSIWEPLMEANLSFAVTDRSGRLLGVSLNWDANKELTMRAPPKVQVIMDFLAAIEKPHLDRLPRGLGNVMSAMLMATDIELTATENIQLVLFMEKENINIATNRGFKAILTSNTSDLTRDVCQCLLNYQNLECTQVNRYIDESGHRVFSTANDSLKVYVAAKFLST